MTPAGELRAADLVRMLAGFGDRAPGEVADELGSLELTWLVTETEQRYAVVIDLDTEEFESVRTVADAARVLNAAVRAAVRERQAPPDSRGGR